MITSAIDGRIRFRSPALRDAETAEKIRRELSATAGITTVAANPRTGSLLVEYVPAAVTQDEVVAAVGLPDDAPATATPAANAAALRVTRAQKMRVAKRGMLVTMAAMLYFALMDEERAHVYAGVAFLGFNAYHQYVYRRRLLA